MLSLNNKASPLYSPGTKVHFLQAFFFSDNRLLSGIYITWLKTLLQPIRCLLWNPKLWLKWWTFPGLQYLHRWLVRTACSPGGKSDFFFLQVPTVWAFQWEVLFRSDYYVKAITRLEEAKGDDQIIPEAEKVLIWISPVVSFLSSACFSSALSWEHSGPVAVHLRRCGVL